jgi:DNA-binding transcriptional ArsR family regulator
LTFCRFAATLNFMVKYDDAALDRTFAALADPTRRALLARLEEADTPLSVSDLARPFDMSLPAVMKHLNVLTEAGLVSRNKSGRIVSCELQAGPMEDAMDWLTRYARFWSDGLDRLTAFVENAAPCPPSNTPNRASRSKDASKPRRKKSSPPGPSRNK